MEIQFMSSATIPGLDFLSWKFETGAVTIHLLNDIGDKSWTFVFPIWFKKESIDKCIKYHSGLILSSHFVGSKIKIHDQLMIRLASQASLSNVFLIYDSLQRLGSL